MIIQVLFVWGLFLIPANRKLQPTKKPGSFSLRVFILYVSLLIGKNAL